MRANKNNRESIEEFLSRVFTEWNETKENPDGYKPIIQNLQRANMAYVQEITNVVEMIQTDPDLATKLSYYLDRLNLLVSKGPTTLEKLDQEKLRTGISQSVLIEQFL